MATRLTQVVIDARDPRALARFWADALGWTVVVDDPDEMEIGGGPDDVNLLFEPVASPSAAKSRAHLDLAPGADQAATVERLLALGARRVDVGQPADATWVVLADPEGNELCVLRPGKYDEHTGPVAAICINAEDPDALLEFWSAATGWGRSEWGLRGERGPHLVFGGGRPGPKTAKNRVHLDVAPFDGDDQDAEVARLERAGARRIDVGQGDVSWVVLADPEGNELCVLTPR